MPDRGVVDLTAAVPSKVYSDVRAAVSARDVIKQRLADAHVAAADAEARLVPVQARYDEINTELLAARTDLEKAEAALNERASSPTRNRSGHLFADVRDMAVTVAALREALPALRAALDVVAADRRTVAGDLSIARRIISESEAGVGAASENVASFGVFARVPGGAQINRFIDRVLSDD